MQICPELALKSAKAAPLQKIDANKVPKMHNCLVGLLKTVTSFKEDHKQ